MPVSSPESPPPLGSLRIAGLDDVLRLGIVCTAGFRYAEQFIWERPYHEQHPHATILFFRHEVEEFIKSPEHVVLVATDRYDPNESGKTDAVIPVDNDWQPPAPGSDVVVALAIWKLEPGSQRVSCFPAPPGEGVQLPEYDGSDMDHGRARKVAETCEAAEYKYLSGLSSLERIVTHPAYWRRGHGTELTRWGVSLAAIDGVDQGVIGSSMGARLFEHVGFHRITDIHVDGDEKDPEGFDLAVLRYETAAAAAESSRGYLGCVVF